jgi:hypothetical protein
LLAFGAGGTMSPCALPCGTLHAGHRVSAERLGLAAQHFDPRALSDDFVQKFELNERTRNDARTRVNT